MRLCDLIWALRSNWSLAWLPLNQQWSLRSQSQEGCTGADALKPVLYVSNVLAFRNT